MTQGDLIVQEGKNTRLTVGDSTGEELSSSSLIGSQIRSIPLSFNQSPCLSTNLIIGSVYKCICDPDHRALGLDLTIVDLDLRLKFDCFEPNFLKILQRVSTQPVSSSAAL